MDSIQEVCFDPLEVIAVFTERAGTRPVRHPLENVADDQIREPRDT